MAAPTFQTMQERDPLYRLLFERAPHPAFVCDADTGRFIAVNQAAVRRYGYSRHELLKMKAADLCTAESLADFREHLRNARSNPPPTAGRHGDVFRHRRKNGMEMDAEVSTTLIPVEGKRLLLLLAEDVTARQRAEKRLHAQHATTRALADSSTVAEASPEIFRAICENLGCDWGELWRVNPATDMLRCTQIWHPKHHGLPELERITANAALARGEGLPGAVWLRNKPLWIPNLAQYVHSRRMPIMTKYGLRSVFAFPIRLNREVLGVIAVFSREVLPLDKHLLRMLRDICSQIGQVMGRRRAERQLLEIAEREQQRIGQDLHDGLCQQLAGVAYMASSLGDRLAKKSTPEAAVASRISRLSSETAMQARQIARGLNPVKVGTMGLIAALHDLASSIQLMFSISCRFKCQHRVVIADHETGVHLYRIAQEAIHNAITHGKASQIVVSLERVRHCIYLSIKDNGLGFSKVSGDGNGTGMENMHYRARAIGARLEFRARQGGGTAVNCTLSSRGVKPI